MDAETPWKKGEEDEAESVEEETEGVSSRKAEADVEGWEDGGPDETCGADDDDVDGQGNDAEQYQERRGGYHYCGVDLGGRGCNWGL